MIVASSSSATHVAHPALQFGDFVFRTTKAKTRGRNCGSALRRLPYRPARRFPADLWFERDQLAAPPQLAPVEIEHVIAEGEFHRGPPRGG
jgi:hypothetical protein